MLKKNKGDLYFVSFRNAEVAQVVPILNRRRQGAVYPIQPLEWVLMDMQHEEPELSSHGLLPDT